MTTETYFVKDGKTQIYKTPAARLLYSWDLQDWLALAGTSLASVTTTAVGVAIDGPPFVDGTEVCAWVTGLDEADDATNSVTFRFVCADGSIDYRTIYFLKRH